VDLIRHVHDPQISSKSLVDYALSRFSTDNLSCMVVRFDSKALQQTAERKTEPIGVEGDPPSVKGGISEADAIVKEARKSMSDTSRLDASEEEKHSFNNEVIEEEEEKEPGPELNPEGVGKLASRREKQ